MTGRAGGDRSASDSVDGLASSVTAAEDEREGAEPEEEPNPGLFARRLLKKLGIVLRGFADVFRWAKMSRAKLDTFLSRSEVDGRGHWRQPAQLAMLPQEG